MNEKSGPAIASDETISLKVLFFATLKERTGKKILDATLPQGSRVADLKAWIADQYPQTAASLPTCLVAINREFASDQDELLNGVEIAFFPPVSGGDEGFPTIFHITEASLDLNNLLEQITLPTTGAACFFSGMVRAKTMRGRSFETDYLEYEAYQEMAEAKMRQVADEIRGRWPNVEGIAIVQRIGRLDPGTPTVVVACTAAHRDMGVFEAARYGIDRLKEIVPVWKKEVGPTGELWIEGNYIPESGE